MIFQPRPDLKIYKSKEVGSLLRLKTKKEKKKLVIECIDRHPCMSIEKSNNYYFNEVLEKVT